MEGNKNDVPLSKSRRHPFNFISLTVRTGTKNWTSYQRNRWCWKLSKRRNKKKTFQLLFINKYRIRSTNGFKSTVLRTLKQIQIPGLVVVGGDSCFEGRGFKSQGRTLGVHFVTYICCKNRIDKLFEKDRK